LGLQDDVEVGDGQGDAGLIRAHLLRAASEQPHRAPPLRGRRPPCGLSTCFSMAMSWPSCMYRPVMSMHGSPMAAEQTGH
jgi:hypothetical protein